MWGPVPSVAAGQQQRFLTLGPWPGRAQNFHVYCLILPVFEYRNFYPI